LKIGSGRPKVESNAWMSDAAYGFENVSMITIVRCLLLIPALSRGEIW